MDELTLRTGPRTDGEAATDRAQPDAGTPGLHGRRLAERRYRQALERAHLLESQLRVQTVRLAELTAHPELPPEVQAQLRGLEQELQALRAEHERVTRSTAWRIGRRMRTVAQSHPQAARWGRRALKLGWWTVSLRLNAQLRRQRDARQGLALLKATPLFDRGWYAARYAEHLPPGTDPVVHYFWVGAALGFDPHPLFDGEWYRSQLPPKEAMLNPLVHYLSTDPARAPDPHPLFDGAFFRRQLAEPPAPRRPLLEHYLSLPAGARPAANPVLDPAWYREEHLAGAPSGTDALAHYAAEGEDEGRFPHPLFDPVWYVGRHPEAATVGALAHYLHQGGREQRLACSEAMEELGLLEALPMALAFPAHPEPAVSIIIPAYGHLFETWRCLASVMRHTEGVPYEVILADDRPSAPVAPLLAADNLVAYVNETNLGFLRNSNAAAARARGRFLLFLNNDTTVGRDWLRPMLTLMQADPRVGAVGCKLLNPDGTVQEAGGIIYSNGWGDPCGKGDRPDRGCYNYVREVDVVTGACFLVRRDLFDALGGFDDRYAPAFYEEFDLVTAMRDQGYKVLYQPASVVRHFGSASYGVEARDRQTERNHKAFCKKWRTLLASQPAPDEAPFLAYQRPSPRGIILVIDDKVPEYDKHAGAVTLLQYLLLLCELGLRVVYHPQDGKPLQPYTDTLQKNGIEVLHAPDRLDHWLERNGTCLDFVWVARPDVAHPILPLLKRTTGATILYYTHDLHYLREWRHWELEGNAWALEESQRLKPKELAIFAEVDRVMTPSAEEAEIIRAEVPQANVTVVPPYLFADAGTASAPADLHARGDLLFVGGFDHTPNVDAALWLVAEIMPLVWAARPDTRLWIVGNVPPPSVQALAGPRVEVTGFVPSLEPYLAKARVSVNPLRYGAGVKGKIVTALQEGVPVVTTGCGNEGIQLRDGVEALIADTPEGLAEACLRLLGDDALSRSLATAGLAVVRSRFSASRARAVMLDLLGDRVCTVCGIRPRRPIEKPYAEWRESTSCTTCGALNRTAALSRVLLAPYGRHRVSSVAEALPLMADLRIHEFGADGALLERLRTLGGATWSEYIDGVAPGTVAPDGTRCEDIQRLSFETCSIDLFVSQDVMEHVADPWSGFAEIHRCLKPGGRHVFTVPYDAGRPATRQRARMLEDAVEHLLPEARHGDPRRPEGALVFSEYGADLRERLEAIGFAVTIHEIALGGRPEGELLLVFETRRNA